MAGDAKSASVARAAFPLLMSTKDTVPLGDGETDVPAPATVAVSV
jgi:hypothetical protein